MLWIKTISHRRYQENCVPFSVTISGYCEIGENSFLGINCCIADYKKIAADCIIGAGAVVIKDTQKGNTYAGNPAAPLDKSSYKCFKVVGAPE
jgi:acetyltransferase-like isoleucine patch superfamily enzyme